MQTSEITCVYSDYDKEVRRSGIYKVLHRCFDMFVTLQNKLNLR